MKYKYLILLFFLCTLPFTKGYAQNLKLENLIKLNQLNLEEFQEYMYGNQFSFLHAKTNSKTDTISFVNKKDVVAGFIVSKKKNTVFVENIKEDYFGEINSDLNSPDFILVETKVKSENILEKIYINTKTENIIQVSVISNTKESNQIENLYKLTVVKPTTYVYRKYLSKVKK